jgi:dihydrofolate reductase
MKVSMIVAVAKNAAIGKDNQLLWRLSEDLKLFKKRTMGHPIIMGRKTFDSIGKALPGRLNIVISRNKSLEILGCTVVSSVEEAIDFASKEPNVEEVFVIGGEKIYDLSRSLATNLYLTVVDVELEGDAFFEYQEFLDWKVLSKTVYKKDEKNEYDFEVFELEKNPTS